MTNFNPEWFTAVFEAIDQAQRYYKASPQDINALPNTLPSEGLGTNEALQALASKVFEHAQHLGAKTAFAHMDPPTATVAQAATWWNATLNQNLLHPDTAPVARELEKKAIDWLAPLFSMNGGHMLPGSTVANITGIWAARELRGIKRVISSSAAHLSIAKATHLLGLEHQIVDVDHQGALDLGNLNHDLSDACLVLTAGTTSTGAIDPLNNLPNAAWVHVDAAWAGPMRLSPNLSPRLDGIEKADSIAISAHKWLFQPKESALILFKDTASSHDALAFGGAYLAAPNIGLLGSHGAIGVPLIATLMAWGQTGITATIEESMRKMDLFAAGLAETPGIALYGPNMSGVLAWQLETDQKTSAMLTALPNGSTSSTHLNGRLWCRNVAANPLVDEQLILTKIRNELNT